MDTYFEVGKTYCPDRRGDSDMGLFTIVVTQIELVRRGRGRYRVLHFDYKFEKCEGEGVAEGKGKERIKYRNNGDGTCAEAVIVSPTANPFGGFVCCADYTPEAGFREELAILHAVRRDYGEQIRRETGKDFGTDEELLARALQKAKAKYGYDVKRGYAQ